MQTNKPGRMLDGAFVRRRLTPLLLLPIWLALLVDYFQRRGLGWEIPCLVLAGTAVAVLISDEMRAGIRAQYRRLLAEVRMLVAKSRAHKRRTVCGRIRVVTPVRDPMHGDFVAAYLIADPSPRERWYTPVLNVVFYRSVFYLPPQDAIRSSVGEVVIELDDGQHARIDTDAVEIFDRRHMRDSRHVVLREGDQVELSGIAVLDATTGTFVFDGSNDSVVRLVLIKRA